ncbi:MAG: 23S rRNA (adenine(2503)-C(2))-methyltransferase RlmN [Opitutaceae bacterium]|jgi:23S rRNA (adenine2503-C2)-methyltransferase|nr:23S rRNA (adenine(2503)-C(2))-methyltransferase RlmN [Opitutaceae bacterium]
MQQALADFSIEGFEALIASWGFKPSHAARLLASYYEGGGAADWDALALPAGLRGRIESELRAGAGEVAARRESDDGTVKLLLRLHDGRAVEAVMMPDFRGERAAGCISSQAGCAMGCDFCATARGGFERNLGAGEMVAQFLALRREARAAGRRLRTVVFMGMGEPMLNLDAVLEAVRRIADNRLGRLGWRQVTVSTVGIVPGMRRLAESGLNVHLAVSLHAPDDGTRALLLPPGRRFRVEEILAVAAAHQVRTGRIPIIQYCLLRGVNDSPAQAGRLVDLLAGRRMHVNLLRYNPTGAGLSGRIYEPSPDEAAAAFLAVLRGRGVVAHFRKPRGRDIDAACGQLRGRAGG